MVLVYYVVHLMVPHDRYFIEMSTLLDYFRLKDGLPNLTVIQPPAISSQVTYFFTQQWPDPLSTGTYQFEIISTGLRNLTMPH